MIPKEFVPLANYLLLLVFLGFNMLFTWLYGRTYEKEKYSPSPANYHNAKVYFIVMVVMLFAVLFAAFPLLIGCNG